MDAGRTLKLVEPAPCVLAIEKRGIAKMLPGPGNWALEQDAFHLKESFGQKSSFRSIQVVAQAAKARVKYMHDCHRRREAALSITSIHSMASSIRSSTAGYCSFPDRALLWKHWYKSSFPLVLDQNEQHLRQQHGIRIDDVLLQIAGGPQPWDAQTRLKQKRLLQK